MISCRKCVVPTEEPHEAFAPFDSRADSERLNC